MCLSLFIARIFGLCYLVLGTGLLLNRKNFKRVMDDFINSAALLFLGGLVALAIGVLIVLKHNIWVADWRVIITIIGWLGLAKGVWIIVFPQTVYVVMQAYKKNENLFVIHSVAALIFGAVLAFFGFFSR